VLGIDLADGRNYWKVARANQGLPPVVSTDPKMEAAYRRAHQRGNLLATHLPEAYALASVVVVDIHLDIHKQAPGRVDGYRFSLEGYERSLAVVADRVAPGTLVLVETTVPPGTTRHALLPLFRSAFERRGLDPAGLLLAHSYERVMPGPGYLDSIVNFHRVFAGVDAASARAARGFLESFINTADFPLSELRDTNASEMAKVLENSFRAMNIAFVQEWTLMAERAGVDLFEVGKAIRVRPTHRNLMLPGFGVGGYCLTKDSLLADWADRHFFGSEDGLGMSLRAVATNDLMPSHAFRRLEEAFGGRLAGKRVALLGVSYLNDVADTRHSPSELFFDLCRAAGAEPLPHDPLVEFWQEKDLRVATRWDGFEGLDADAVVLAVRHSPYLALDGDALAGLFPKAELFLDANDVLTEAVAEALRRQGRRVIGVGKGHWG